MVKRLVVSTKQTFKNGRFGWIEKTICPKCGETLEEVYVFCFMKNARDMSWGYVCPKCNYEISLESWGKTEKPKKVFEEV